MVIGKIHLNGITCLTIEFWSIFLVHVFRFFPQEHGPIVVGTITINLVPHFVTYQKLFVSSNFFILNFSFFIVILIIDVRISDRFNTMVGIMTYIFLVLLTNP